MDESPVPSPVVNVVSDHSNSNHHHTGENDLLQQQITAELSSNDDNNDNTQANVENEFRVTTEN